jgi:cytosine/adenosine deaminase-related metal-dependent hydrolase
MIVRAPVIVTMNRAPIENGAVRIRGDRTVQAGKSSELEPSDEHTIDLKDYVLLPGLINAHCHLDYTCLRGRIGPPDSFTDWIRAINAAKAGLTADDYLKSINAGSREALRFGTTSLVNLEAFPELIARCSPGPLRVWWCAELIDVSAPDRTRQIVEGAAADLLANRNSRAGLGLAPHAVYTASTELIRRCMAISEREGFLLTIHLAESREETEMFREGAGPLFEFLRKLGRDDSDCGHATPLERFLQIIRDPSIPNAFGTQNDNEKGLPRWIVAHLNDLTDRDFKLLADLPERFSIVHCPRSHAYFRHSPFAFEQLQNLGFNICLATDSLASNSDLSLFAEMRAFQKSHPQISAEEILKMVTVNPAVAIERARELGRIASGYLADMIALPLAGATDVYEQIIAFDKEVPWMMIGGEIL